MEVKQLDFVLVSLGLLVFGVYHIWLVITVKRNPRHTVIGLNAESRCQWVFCLMAVCFTPLSPLYFFVNCQIFIQTIVGSTSGALVEVSFRLVFLELQTCSNSPFSCSLFRSTIRVLSIKFWQFWWKVEFFRQIIR